MRAIGFFQYVIIASALANMVACIVTIVLCKQVVARSTARENQQVPLPQYAPSPQYAQYAPYAQTNAGFVQPGMPAAEAGVKY